MNREVPSARFLSYQRMYSQDARLLTYEDWPFREGCRCTPEQMSRVGFIHCPSENEPDITRCFFCLLELEGWEPDDDPWQEHNKRSPDCGFLMNPKNLDQLSVRELFLMEKERLKNYIRKVSRAHLARLRDRVERTRETLQCMLDD
ncbi:baculoviral IAP repeat-containing protein 5b [Synchiropus picturatus]